MLFHTQLYCGFFVAVFILYWVLPWDRVRVYWLLATSVAFYATWNQWLAALVVGTATFDYWLARWLSVTTGRRKRILLLLSIAVNLGVLAYFKYMDFFLASLAVSCAWVGLTPTFPALQIIVPFGISFYTFEAISYVVDVYRGKFSPERRWTNFMLFILFFPHLVAGPIVRGRDFLRQVERPKRWSWLRTQYGLQLIALGVFKKLAIADSMAYYSALVFHPDTDLSTLSGGAVWMAVLAFGIQIYCDFSGYSDIALGSAHLLGYQLAVNFRMPYVATNIADFWRRWHISLSTWLRDYVYIPLGGSRGGPWRTARNLLVTMALGGLWHGPHASFVLWGLLHGALLLLHRGVQSFRASCWWWRSMLTSVAGRLVGTITTFASVTMLWVFFQPSLAHAGALLRKMLVWSKHGDELPLDSNRFWWMVAVFLVAQGLALVGLWRWAWKRVPAPILGVACTLLFFTAQVLSPDVTRAFVYFQF